MNRIPLTILIAYCCILSTSAKEILYVQSPKAKLLSQPQLSAEGSALKVGEILSPTSEQGLFIQVRSQSKTGWVSKLFVSPLPPSSQIKLGVSSNSTETVAARQRASDFTVTAAARGLSETEKLRLRGGAELYDFESLRWLESLPPLRETESAGNTPQTKPAGEVGVLLAGVSDETKQEVKLGRALAARILHKYKLIKNEKFTQYINSVSTRLSAVSSRGDLSFKVGILDSDEINAFACPGGLIFITKGALHKIENESELAGVIGHEIGHVVLFHNGRFQRTNVFIEILAGLLSPSGGEVINTAASAALDEFEKKLFEKGRDASFEWEADEAGVGLASEAGYSKSGLKTYLVKISKSEDASVLKKTHPDTASRISKLDLVRISPSEEGISADKNKWSQYKELMP